MTKHTVYLSDVERFMAEYLAMQIRKTDQEKGYAERKIRTDLDPDELQKMGMRGEWAFAKFFGLYPNLKSKVDRKPWDFLLRGRSVDVKTTDKESGLFVPEWHEPAEISLYVLIFQRTEWQYDLVGWQTKNHVFDNGRRVKSGSYFVPWTDLNPIQPLINWVRESL